MQKEFSSEESDENVQAVPRGVQILSENVAVAH